MQKKNKRGDRKGESNDSPEIPDRRDTSDIHASLGGGGGGGKVTLPQDLQLCGQHYIAADL